MSRNYCHVVILNLLGGCRPKYKIYNTTIRWSHAKSRIRVSLSLSLYARVSLCLSSSFLEIILHTMHYSDKMRDVRDPKWTVLFIRLAVLYFYDPDTPPKLCILGARENALSQGSLQQCQYLLFLADCSFYSHTVITYSQLTAFKGGFP